MFVKAADDGGFHPPSIDEFFPPVVLFEGTPFALTRINLIQIIATVVLIALFVIAWPRGLAGWFERLKALRGSGSS